MKRTLIICSLMFIAMALCADEGDTKQSTSDRPKRPVPPLITALDKNADHVIDATEMTGAPAALKTLDKNGDGKLTREELMPPRPEGAGDGKPGRRPPVADTNAPPDGARGPGKHGGGMPLIKALDKNNDHVIDEKEIEKAAEALKTLDKNGDGQLTADELRPKPPQDKPGRKSKKGTEAETSE